MPSLRTIETEQAAADRILFTTPPLKAGSSFLLKKKKTPLFINHLQKQYIYTKEELHGFIEANKNIAASMLKPQGAQTLSIIEEQINRYEVAKQRKAISSKKVTKELGAGLMILQESLIELTEELNKMEEELGKESTKLVTPLDSQNIPDASLPTLEVVDSSMEEGIIDPDNPNINQTAQQSHESHFKEEEEKKEPRGELQRRDSIMVEDNDDLCFSAVSLVLQCINKLLQVISSLLAIPGIYPADESESKKVRDIKSNLQKKENYHLMKANLARMRLCIEALEAAQSTSPNDLFYLDHSHEDWQKLLQHYSFEDSTHPEPYKSFYKQIAIINATTSKGLRGNNSLVKIIRTGAHLALYGLSSKKAHSQYEQYIVNPDIEISRAVWNLQERSMVKGFLKLFLKKVKHDHVFYIPRTDPIAMNEAFVGLFAQQYAISPVRTTPLPSSISKSQLFDQKASIQTEIMNPSLVLNQAAISEEPTKDVIHAYGEKFLSSPRHFSLQNNEKPHYHDQIGVSYNNELSSEMSHSTNMRRPYSYSLSKKLYDPEHQVMVRLISNKPLTHDIKTGKPKKKNANFGKTFLCCGRLFDDVKLEQEPQASTIRSPSDITRRNQEKGEIVIHVHGGGFIAMSSSSHLNYTRQWAVDTDVPIFSIDYRLAPQNPYPKALDDCWQAYYWIIKHSEEMFGLPPKKVILVGDSAGGNLILGVTLRAIHSNFKVPDGLILCYPALNLSLNCFIPSHLISLEDLILPYSFLKMCLSMYAGEADPNTDPFLSPILINDNDLKRFPPVRIMIAGKDPLRDDSFKFALRLLHVGVDVHIKEFRTFPHGFLSFDMPMGIKQCRRGVKQGTKWIKELFEIASLENKNPIKYTESWDSFRKSHNKVEQQHVQSLKTISQTEP